MLEKEVIITNIRKRAENDTIYAFLKDADNDETLVSATLQYILVAAKERNYNVVNAQEVLEKLNELNYF